MRNTLALSIFAAAAGTAAAQSLFSNAGPNPGTPALAASTSSLSGVAAPQGTAWSELQAGPAGDCNAAAGFSAHAAGEEGLYRLADDFEVPADSLWQIDTLRVYAFVPGHAGGSPFSAISVRIWLGKPGTPDAVVIAGDAEANVLASASLTGIYRIFNTLRAPLPPSPDASRAIWSVDASIGDTVLGPGRYWIDWQITCVNPHAPAFTPSATLASSRSTLGANALQFRFDAGPSVGQWVPIVDSGKPALTPDAAQDLPFMLFGVAIPNCNPDFNQDGNADQDDVGYLTNVIAGGENPAGRDPDFNRDGNVDQDDVLALVDVIAGGRCP
ncbi:MAG: hypothetical protein DYG92_08970 [Leptolyngbya sp. PLA1]|nr:hypothetical protein [Leptolyngbya sp. PLA1]